MRTEIRTFLITARRKTEYRLRLLCGKPAPVKRLIAVLIAGGALAIVNIWYVVSSIYNTGKHDAEERFLKIQHIDQLKIKNCESKTDSISERVTGERVTGEQVTSDR